MRRFGSVALLALLGGAAASDESAPSRNLFGMHGHRERPVVIMTPPEAPEPLPPQQEARVERRDPTSECPEGWTMDGPDCLRQLTTPSKLGCRAGLTLVPGGKGQVCIGQEQVPADVVCEQGYVPVGDFCARKNSAPFSLDCPDGFTVGADACEKKVTAPARVFCPKDYEITDDMCRKEIYAEKQMLCPDGFTMDTKTGQCRRQQSITGSLSCPKGSHLDGDSCYSTKASPASYTCEPGFKLNGNTCQMYNTEAKLSVCPPGWEMTSQGCTRETTVDYEMTCPKGGVLEITAKGEALCKMPPRPPASKKGVYTPTEPEVYLANKACPKGYLPSGGSKKAGACLRTEVQSASYECPEGFSMKGKECVQIIQHAPIPSCPPGTMMNPATNECEQRLTHPPSIVCEDGWVPVTDSNLCARTEIQAPLTGCPPNFVFDGKLDRCQGVESFPPTPVCPGQYEMSSDGICYGRIIAPSIQICPPKYERTETGCEYNEQVPPVPLCPQGYALKFGTTCEREISDKPGRICPAGYQLVSETICAVTEQTDARYACPPGFEFNGKSGKCERTVIVDIAPDAPAQVLDTPMEPEPVMAPQQPVVIREIIQAPAPPPRMVYYPQYIVTEPIEEEHDHHHDKPARCDKHNGCPVSQNIMAQPSVIEPQAPKTGSTSVIVPQAPAYQPMPAGYAAGGTTTLQGYGPQSPYWSG
uniref:Oocyst wall protein n=1 Tax=Chromera velia CCMP2878 TaxID=1169474 RepID=A0A0G4HUK9_9ALVE|eukprot:Cvel_31900.t1-p1 / transcript=Cvel_31900.t1 / gene=Cvel_31900 / organism=Chromera_velia_CCMP2878 / gene_product=Multiple epidermal growth factor-like domains, putative / transcript_product=Multiple epidermal growth factor-like domains, putative / location=Cvel_scaffold4843:3151-6026(+) / protein_length=699 / sequence_SO=supercontig / SO=protein_coding / is_pseudo=false